MKQTVFKKSQKAAKKSQRVDNLLQGFLLQGAHYVNNVPATAKHYTLFLIVYHTADHSLAENKVWIYLVYHACPAYIYRYNVRKVFLEQGLPRTKNVRVLSSFYAHKFDYKFF